MRSVSAPYLSRLCCRGVAAQTPGFAGRVIPVIPATPFLNFIEVYKAIRWRARVICAQRELANCPDRRGWCDARRFPIPNASASSRLMLVALRSEPVAEAQELRLIDRRPPSKSRRFQRPPIEVL